MKNYELQNLVPWDPPGVLWGPILGLNRGLFSKLNVPGPLGSKGYPHTSFNSGKFPDTYKSFHIGVVGLYSSYQKYNEILTLIRLHFF